MSVEEKKVVATWGEAIKGSAIDYLCWENQENEENVYIALSSKKDGG